jgi:nucleotide-binding universal stress UspA family protein
MILICYEGSDDARAAVGRASTSFAGQAATVLTVWQPFIQVVAHTGIGFGMVATAPDSAAIDEASRRRAEDVAREGVEVAEQAGLEAQACVREQVGTTARTILGEAEKLGAQVIVMGSRDLTGVKSLLLGSVSHEVIQHADRAVVIVPSPAVAASRARKVQEEAVALG